MLTSKCSLCILVQHVAKFVCISRTRGMFTVPLQKDSSRITAVTILPCVHIVKTLTVCLKTAYFLRSSLNQIRDRVLNTVFVLYRLFQGEEVCFYPTVFPEKEREQGRFLKRRESGVLRFLLLSQLTDFDETWQEHGGNPRAQFFLISYKL